VALEPDQEGGGEDLARPVDLVVGAGEDLELAVDRLRLVHDPLALSEHVLQRIHEPKADASLAEELAHERGRLRQLGDDDGEVDVGGLLVAVGVAGLLLAGVEAEAAVEPAGEDPVEALLGIPFVTLAQQRVIGGRRVLPSIRVSPRPSE